MQSQLETLRCVFPRSCERVHHSNNVAIQAFELFDDVVLRVPAMDRFYHLHPEQKSDGSFTLRLPAISSGKYEIFADIVRGTGFPETLVSEIDAAGNIVRRIREFLQRGPLMGDVDVRGLLEDVLVLVDQEAVSAGVRIDVVVVDGLPPLRGDRGQLEQVLLNLVRNSIDAILGAQTRAGHIRVAARRSSRPSDLLISVRDNGPGVSADMGGRLFEPLATSKRDGLGLGLSICETIAAAHGGRIWLETTGAEATEFRLTVPFKSGRLA